MHKFIHLRCHTNYSVGEGCLHISSIVDLCKKNNFPAIAMTDTNNMFGARDFSYNLSQQGIQPIIGFELNVFNAISTGKLVLLAKDINGYKNLLKLHDKLYFDRSQGVVDDLKIDLQQIINYAEGVICLTGGIDGFLANIIRKRNNEETQLVINTLISAFKDRLYIELNRLFTEEDISLEPELLKIALDNNIPIVATNNVIFASSDDYEAADIFSCIGQGTTVGEANRVAVNQHKYFKSSQEMIELFKDLPEAIENTINIAKKCCFFVEKKDLSLPNFSDDEENYITEQANGGLTDRLETEVYIRLAKDNKEAIKQLYQERLDFELSVIKKMGFSGYFLIVSDFIKWAKDHDIPVGPGRGSGAGSLVAWCLKITDVDPIQFNLLFERFLNPDRISMPDFDIDFCQYGRDRVIAYVTEKYGKDKVAHIITFGTLQAKAAIKDVGRAMGLPYTEVDIITKKIPYYAPSNPATLEKVIKEQAIKEEIDSKDHIRQLFDVALKLEGLYRNLSTHAAGIVISKDPLNEVVPLFYDFNEVTPSVGFSMKYIEDMGLVKFDFLALKTLTIVRDTVDRIKKLENIDINILQIPYKDEEIGKLLSKGDTLGIFQLESRGMTELIKQLKPDQIEDIIAIISLYRPGPMENIPLYVGNKAKKDRAYMHEKMMDILEETFGIMIYQEQVMQVAQVIAGYTLGSADILRRAMGKKDPVEMDKQRNIFIEGALKTNNIKAKLAGEIFDQMEKFAGYGFNKSHATAYALISWQSAYLKAYYTVEFLVAAMKSDIDNNSKEQDRFLDYIEEAKKYNIKILPPSINHPSLDFFIEKNNGKKDIRFSLLALKGVGEALIQELITVIEAQGIFTSLEDLLTRVNNKVLNKKQLESLIKAGALDTLHHNRKQLLDNIEALLNFNRNVFENNNSNQIGLFDVDSSSNNNILKLTEVAQENDKERRIQELEVIGYFLSGHPLEEFDDILKKQDVKSYNEMVSNRLPYAYLAGYLIKIKVSKARNGGHFANLTFYDRSSTFSIALFGDNYTKLISSIKEGENYIIKANAKIDEEETRLFIENIYELNKAYKIKTSKKITETKESVVNLTITIQNEENLEQLRGVISNNIGKDTLNIKIRCDNKYLTFTVRNIVITEVTKSKLVALGFI